MHPVRKLFPSALAAACLFAPRGTWALTDEVTGSNLTADEGLGAREQGMGLLHSGFQVGADAVINAPASMNDVNDFTFSTSHWEQFDAATYDNAALLVPWHANGTMGLAIARYAVSGIESRPVGDMNAIPNSVFTTSDWLISGSLSRRFGGLDVGGTVDLLYRDLGDQVGLGLRADGMAEYTFSGQYRAGFYIRGIVPSVAQWESGFTEYEPPEANLFVSGRWDIPYFYGRLEASLETPGLIESGARSQAELEGSQAIADPVSLLKTSMAGAEFRFDFGLCIRAGLSEINPYQAASSLTLGAGYGWRNIIGVDYAYTSNDALSNTQRIALWWTPAFPRFEGRSFRPRLPTGSVAPDTSEQHPEGTATPAIPETGEKAKRQSVEPKPDTDKGKGKEILEDD